MCSLVLQVKQIKKHMFGVQHNKTYSLCVCVCLYLQDTAGDVRGYLSMRRVLCVLTLWGEVMFQTRLPEPHQRRAVLLDGARLPDGRGDARYANLHHSLVVVVGQIVLSAGRR